MPFLTAAWRHLIMANYEVDPALLQEWVPLGTSLDLFEGKAYVSLVAFWFENTKVLGIPVPWHRHFEEVNLRFYIKPDRDPSLRAVTFLKEIVPLSAIPLIANTFFHERYVRMPMSHSFSESWYRYGWGERQENSISAKQTEPMTHPNQGSVAEFITEHYWGYAQGPRRTVEYHVVHEPWRSCRIQDYTIKVDFESLYGPTWAFLKDQQPSHVLLAEGSSVSVSFPGKL